jgi:hypothetical protein
VVFIAIYFFAEHLTDRHAFADERPEMRQTSFNHAVAYGGGGVDVKKSWKRKTES